MNVLNYGAGAVGLGIDSCLVKSKAKVFFVARAYTAKALKENGLKRMGIFGEVNILPDQLNVYTSLAEVPEMDFDFILVSTKSFDSRATAENLAKFPKLIGKNTKLVLCQNGWGNAEIFAEFFPKEIIYNARVITGFTRPTPNEVVVTVHADDIHIGSLFSDNLDCLQPLCKAITDGGIPCQTASEIEKDLWAKMLYNCALNPLGAILGVSYGTLAEHKETKEIMNTVITEIYAVMKTAGYRTHWDTPKEYLEVFYSEMVPATASHKSSTLQSLKAKKRTEIDALIGIVVKLAKEYDVPAPANQTLLGMMKFLEKN